MGIEENQVSNEEKQNIDQSVQDKTKSVADEFLKEIDLSAEESEETEKKNYKKSIEEEESEEDSEDDDSDEPGYESDESEEYEEEESEEETEDDLIPRSKVQKRIDAITAEKRALEERVAALESQRAPKQVDEQRSKLEAMSEAELKSLKRQTLIEWKNESDDDRSAQLMELNEKIDDVMKSAPVRFESKQVSKLHEAVKSTVSRGEVKDFEKASNEIFKLAKEIFQDSETLKKSESGQAEAWKLAVRHYKAISSSSGRKVDNKQLKRQINNLKKKTSLDSGSMRGSESRTRTNKLFEKAKHGDMYAKEAYVKHVLPIDDFIPDQFKE